jgi:hypothetical protein
VRASASETGSGTFSTSRPGEEIASAMSVPSWRTRTDSPSPRSTAMAVSSGTGRRSVTVTAPSKYAAMRPLT